MESLPPVILFSLSLFRSDNHRVGIYFWELIHIINSRIKCEISKVGEQIVEKSDSKNQFSDLFNLTLDFFVEFIECLYFCND